MDIKNEEYTNNLLFYTILKNLIKCHMPESKIIILENLINENKNLEYSKLIEFLENNVINPNVKAYEAILHY